MFVCVWVCVCVGVCVCVCVCVLYTKFLHVCECESQCACLHCGKEVCGALCVSRTVSHECDVSMMCVESAL